MFAVATTYEMVEGSFVRTLNKINHEKRCERTASNQKKWTAVKTLVEEAQVGTKDLVGQFFQKMTKMGEDHDRRITKMGEDHDRRITKMGEDHDRRITKMEEDITQLTHENGEMRGSITQLTHENGEMRESITQLTHENGEMRKRITRLELSHSYLLFRKWMDDFAA